MINTNYHRVTFILKSKYPDIVEIFQYTFKDKVWRESDISLVVLFFTSLNFVSKSSQENFKKISIQKCHQ